MDSSNTHQLAVLYTGACVFTVVPNYNTRSRIAEEIINDDRIHLAHKREAVAELFAGEAVLP